MPQTTAENIDRLITIEMRPLGIPRGVMPALYERVRHRVGSPLTLRAAHLIKNTPAGSTVFIATGAGAPEVLPKGETDGPLGVAALARIIARGIGAVPVILTTTGYEEPIVAALDAYETPAEILSLSAEADPAAAADLADRWLTQYEPSLAVASEMKGTAADGKLHFMTGRECTVDARLDQVFRRCTSRGIKTLGIGDGGNEIGFGGFEDEVIACHPNGHVIASTVPTDVLVVAAISNWGCYGVEAMLARLLERPDLIHDADMGTRAMEACAAAGAGDGIYTRPLPLEDGLPTSVHRALMCVLTEIVHTGLTSVEHALRVD